MQKRLVFSCGWGRVLILWIIAAGGLVRAETRGAIIDPTEAIPVTASAENPPVASTLELQVELHRRGFSCGSIDGVLGDQTLAALRAFQRRAGIADTGIMDAATQRCLLLSAPALDEYVITTADLAGLHPVPDTWLEKSQMANLGYASALELVSERYHAHPDLLRHLNPQVDWAAVLPGTKIVVPAVNRVVVSGTAEEIVILLGERALKVVDSAHQVIAQFPVSIARIVDKRPIGSLHITTMVADPDYTFDPDSYPESAEGKALGRSLVLPPGPNNPVGLAWIGLDRPGYGIHGTPEPENVGRTESHGCFRLANWDALTLLALVRLGMPVKVEP